jgi:pimeloyl-ACP methyl ester carboxylesterase
VELWGYSLGAGVAVQLAAELCGAGTPPRRLVLLSAYDRIAVMRDGPFGRLLPGDVYDAIGAAGRVTCPTTIVHGVDDDALPLSGSRALHRTLGPRARLVELPGRGHVDYLGELAALGL